MKKKLLSLLVLSGLFTVGAGAQTTFKDGVFTFTVTGETTVELSAADSKDASGVSYTSYEIPETVSGGVKITM